MVEGTPNTCQPSASAARVTARTAAFMPGASPPLVRTAIRFKPGLQPSGRRTTLAAGCSGGWSSSAASILWKCWVILRLDTCTSSASSCAWRIRSEEHTSELQSHHDLVCRLLLEKKKKTNINNNILKTKKKYKKTH